MSAALRDLRALAAQHSGDEDAAAIEYEVWTINHAQDQARQKAARLYQRTIDALQSFSTANDYLS